ncbi:MAG: hypothetical protein NC408_03185 [Candidatus Gastranaerophilales bacterium]|nr:hypothetical protein [Candidatus Gastranaerophilales bacterium]MCM1073712.1 hypothetical protein [Bacteroides sp.]
MDINAVGYGSAMTPEVQAQYGVKLIQMARASEQAAASVILDAVEISQEAMDKFLAERG